MKSVERILVLVNPAAANNSAHHLWGRFTSRFEALFSSYDCTTVETQSRQHTIALGASTDADLIISVGGDGTVHDIAQGLMQRPRSERPLLAVVPIGSGNDYARTLSLPSNPLRALEALSEGVRLSIDAGRCNETIFLETLSFGIDAAIAFRTIDLRRRTNSRGLLLYARAAIAAILHDLKAHHFTITLGDAEPLERDLLICAIQNGPTYGGGFRIAPNACANDGLLNICMAFDVTKAYALWALTLVARGTHERLPIINTFTTQHLVVELAREIPAQCDGEVLRGTRFDIEVIPDALDVLVSRNSPLLLPTL
ncbi:MAG: diacylglycerol kinase family lipid kinase [Coriobacteriales bacterium]|jgi:YegS/Rv2252/BmrU family lipid kinase|nr:diacylglycerol kinase family lipid kinase [Coriobacteriales bacterium]